MKPTKQQQAAIDSDHPRILCMASPGSGKTFVGAERVKRLIKGGCDPKEIAVITYTNVAAREFEQRLNADNPARQLERVVETVVSSENIDRKSFSEAADYCGPEIKLGFLGTTHAFCLRHIELFGDTTEPVTVMDDEEAQVMLLETSRSVGVKASAKQLNDCRENWLAEKEQSTTPVRIAVGYYYREMLRQGRYDYNSLLEEALRLLKDPKRPQRRWSHLIVDELQDVSAIDMRIYESIIAENRFYVGDYDQSVFGFRKSDPREILRLSNDPKWEKHALETNFRSGAAICEAAQRLIERAKERPGKATVSANGSIGCFHTEEHENAATEAHRHAARLLKAASEGKNMDSYAVLTRTHAVADYLRDFLRAQGVEVREKSVLPEDWQKACGSLRALATPVFHVITPSGATIELTGDADKLALELLMLGVSDESISIIKAKFDEMPTTASLRDLSIALAIEGRAMEAAGSGVSVLTIHGAKGREFDVVIVAGFEDEVIPGKRKAPDIEEERRLAYVAFTRARKELIVSWSKSRVPSWSQYPYKATPSRFLAEALA